MNNRLYNIAIVGESGTGKTTSLENLDPTKTVIISPYKSDLPFEGWEEDYQTLSIAKGTGNLIRTNNISEIGSILKYIIGKRPDIDTVVIDDLTHFQTKVITSAEFRGRKNGNEAFAKWQDFAADVKDNLFPEDIKDLDRDIYVIHVYHAEKNDQGEQDVKVVGKMLKEKIDLPSYYNYVLYTTVLPHDPNNSFSDRYKFVVNNDGTHLAKTPKNLYSELYIPNDLNAVIQRIKEFRTTKRQRNV